MAAQEFGLAGDALCLREMRLRLRQRNQFVEPGPQRLSGGCLDATAKNNDRLAKPPSHGSYPDGGFARQGYLRR
jgi:hypothetical protein